MAKLETDRPGMNPIMKFFDWEHLPDHLQVISRPFSNIAHEMEARLPASAEKSAGLRKILEAKDCMVRAALPAKGDKGQVRFGKFMISKEADSEIVRCKDLNRREQAIRVLISQAVDRADAVKGIENYWKE